MRQALCWEKVICKGVEVSLYTHGAYRRVCVGDEAVKWQTNVFHRKPHYTPGEQRMEARYRGEGRVTVHAGRKTCAPPARTYRNAVYCCKLLIW